jgi:hypothetical protein
MAVPKSRPTFSLDDIKKLLQRPETRVVTGRALREAASLGYANEEEMLQEVQLIQKTEFEQSIPCDHNPKVWQDVYILCRRHPLKEGRQWLYVKLQLGFDGSKAILISFHAAEDPLDRRVPYRSRTQILNS